ncbi:MAG TPA: MBL fold metallo-hydrolase, partial [Candidatus Limnocylindria bacterium]|nr:MBL fold metallo-hydrolase [Candidatus Limnocylindria bacterium]
MVARRLLPALLAGVLACAPTPSPRPGDHHGSDADLAITRLGHAGLLVTLGSTHLLVDPWFHDRLLVRQREPIGVQPSGLPAVRAVLLTDDEATRADPDALAELAPSVPLAVGPPRLRRRLAALGFRQIVTLEHWQQAAIDGVRLTAVPGRGNGYLLQAGPSTVYVAGEDADAAVATEVARAAGGIDVALVPI